ncbi:MAG: hypothetical protein K8I02_01595, partial [Candidatus Methylomirabilis sp.]|nr:hypothetical protein [Deltaproteobacteria bacterium]
AEPPNPMLAPYRRDYPNDAERPGVDLSLAMLAEMRRASEAAGARFLLVTIDSHASQEALWRAMLAHPDVRAEDYDRDHAEALLGAFAEREGFPVLHLAETLRAHADEALFFETDPHFTALGHARAAEAVALRLRELGWTN